MKFFIIYKENGQIIRDGCCQDDVFDLQARDDEFILESDATWEGNYVDNGVVLPLPIKPDGYYVFDYSAKEWIFDYTSADTAAKQQRDILLAEGPDRISPLWWSTMTQEEQQSWTDYRQALLDITSQPNYPQEITWPTKP